MYNYNDITNEEIWEMLKSKMENNGVKSKVSIINSPIDDYFNNEVETIKAYYESDVTKAVAIAYRSGYERGMEDRSFKFGKKKKKKRGGHWEPIDPNNLPKEWTKVRYSREIDNDYSIPFAEWSGMKINDETVVMYAGFLFGVKDIYNKFPNSKYVCCDDYPNRFDMWVEDDE